ncbi:MAG: hypothetical protein PHV78_00725 [Patescibacteria group bacterium]|nr:hypothetical protein [Patescibacteria group bacterium]MDD5121308.1 hypothetical protein [Patescibacteria group bacterium]MDD5221738.1 hypothetical protein [Patescibacteria group bacterium]MDD5395773.1 hypothetical protein [Patescibacteria group bacterium]
MDVLAVAINMNHGPGTSTMAARTVFIHNSSASASNEPCLLAMRSDVVIWPTQANLKTIATNPTIQIQAGATNREQMASWGTNAASTQAMIAQEGTGYLCPIVATGPLYTGVAMLVTDIKEAVALNNQGSGLNSTKNYRIT